MTITATVYLNEAADSFRGFQPFRSELRQAVTFEIDATEPEFTFTDDRSLSNDEFDAAYRAARTQHETWVNPHLEGIFRQLNIGGDMTPADAYTVEYRMAGNRSLSVGDLVVLEWDRELANVTRDGAPVVVHEREAFSVESAGFKRRSSLVVRKGLENYARNEGSLDHYVPQARTDLAVNDEGLFVLKNAYRPASSYTYEFVQEDLRNGL